jgi:hypothetical protein
MTDIFHSLVCAATWVTRFGEFSQSGWLFSFGQFFENYRRSPNAYLVNFFSRQKRYIRNNEFKMVLVTLVATLWIFLVHFSVSSTAREMLPRKYQKKSTCSRLFFYEFNLHCSIYLHIVYLFCHCSGNYYSMLMLPRYG